MSELLKYVTPLRGADPKSFRAWRLKYMAAVNTQTVSEEQLTGKEPFANSAAGNKAKAMAYSLLVATLSDDLLHLVEKFPMNDIVNAWKAVYAYFTTESRQAQRLRKTSFFKMYFKRGDLFSRWVADLQNTARQINEYYAKQHQGQDGAEEKIVEITDREMVDALLEGVLTEHRNEFDPIITVIDNMEQPPTFDEVVKKLTPVAARHGLDQAHRPEQANPAADKPPRTPYIMARIKNPHLKPCNNMARDGNCKFGSRCVFSHDKQILQQYDPSKDKHNKKEKPKESKYGRQYKKKRCQTCRSTKHSTEGHDHAHMAHNLAETQKKMQEMQLNLDKALKKLEQANHVSDGEAEEHTDDEEWAWVAQSENENYETARETDKNSVKNSVCAHNFRCLKNF